MTVTNINTHGKTAAPAFGLLARTSREHYFRLDPDGTIGGYHGGKPAGDAGEFPFLGVRLPELFPPEVGAEFRRGIGRAVEEGRLTTFEFTLALAGGKETFTARIVPLPPGLIVAGIRNVTARTRTREALRLVEERFHTIFRHTAAGMALTFPDDGFIKVNPAFCRFLGYTMDEVMRLRLTEVVHPDDHELFPATVREGAQDCPTLTKEQRFLRRDGAIAWGHASITWFYDGTGSPVYAVHLIQDISELKRTEKENERLNASLATRAAELEATNRELEAFNHTASHDLRAPLTGIAGYSEMLLHLCGDGITEQCRGYLEQIFAASRRMGFLINALLNFSRLSRSEMRRERVDLSTLARELALELHMQVPEREVEFSIAPEMEVVGDERLLRVVLQNLFDNAWKYTGRTKTARIECGAAECQGVPVYFVRDNGIGFDASLAQRLFEPFQRLHDEQDFPGSGIGLATVERIIRRHGGRVWAEGEPDRGACFFFTLPEP
jgi:PAS domain S-box-containing protein